MVVTTKQKQVFLDLAAKYDVDALQVVTRGLVDQIIVNSEHDVRTLDKFANHICDAVLKNYADYEDINADAVLVANIVP